MLSYYIKLLNVEFKAGLDISIIERQTGRLIHCAM